MSITDMLTINPLEKMLERARQSIDNIYDPEPKVKEPHEIIVKLHERYNQLRRMLSENRGEQEAQIIELCTQLVGDVADVAVLFERGRQKP